MLKLPFVTRPEPWRINGVNKGPAATVRQVHEDVAGLVPHRSIWPMPMASMAHGEPGEEDPEAGGPTEQGDGVGPVVSHGDLLKDEHNGMAEL